MMDKYRHPLITCAFVIQIHVCISADLYDAQINGLCG